MRTRSKLDVNSDALRVLVATPFFPSPARPYAGTFVANQCTELARLGADIRVIAPLPRVIWLSHCLVPRWRALAETPREYSWSGIEVTSPRYFTLPKNLALLWGAGQVRSQLLRCVRGRGGIGLIHGHGTLPVGVAAVQAGAELGLPVVLTVHGTDINKYPFLSRSYMRIIQNALSSATLVLAVSENLASKVIAIEPSSKVRVHRIGIDLAAFEESPGADSRRCATADRRQFRIIYVGRLVRAKGVYDLLEGFELFLSVLGDIDSELVFVGDGREAASLKAMCEHSGALRSRVRFTGAVPHSHIPEILSGADILVLPSYSEGLGMVIVEAMAAGVPCIGSKVGGIPEVIADGYNGILVQPGSPREIADAIGRLASSQGLWTSLSHAARHSIRSNHDIQRNSLALMQIYREVMQH